MFSVWSKQSEVCTSYILLKKKSQVLFAMAIDANSILAISAWAPAKQWCFLFDTKIGSMHKLHTSEQKNSQVLFAMATDANSMLAISAWAPAKNWCVLCRTKTAGMRELHKSEKNLQVLFAMVSATNLKSREVVWASLRIGSLFAEPGAYK